MTDATYPHTCQSCGERFGFPVWHCPNCNHHYHADDNECGNCYSKKPTQDRNTMLIHVAISEVKINQRKRSINSQKVQELAKSISEIGLLNPISITSERVLIAGLHRLEAYKILGKSVTIPAMVVAYEDALTLELAEIDENLIRNELMELEQALHLARRKEIYEKKYPQAKHGGDRGNQYTGGKEKVASPHNEDLPPESFADNTSRSIGRSRQVIERKVKIGDALAPHAERLLDTPVADSQKDLLALSRMDDEKREQVIDKLVSGESKDVKTAETAIRREVAAEQGAAIEVLPSNLTLLHGDFRELIETIDSDSVDLVFTDPPYHEEHLPLWDALAKESARVLKPGGMLVAYSGQVFLDYVMSALGKHLQYYWIIGIEHTHGQLRLWNRKVWNSWKPVLIYTKGKPDHNWFQDFIRSGESETKNLHDWSQPMAQAEEIISRFAPADGLVLDVMCGAGTIPIAAVKNGRKSIGIEMNEETYNIARGRAEEVLSETD